MTKIAIEEIQISIPHSLCHILLDGALGDLVYLADANGRMVYIIKDVLEVGSWIYKSNYEKHAQAFRAALRLSCLSSLAGVDSNIDFFIETYKHGAVFIPWSVLDEAYSCFCRIHNIKNGTVFLKDDRYPSKCPYCGKPAYVSGQFVEHQSTTTCIAR